jgi:hypothetical protein
MAKFEKVKRDGTVQFGITIFREPGDRHFWELCSKFHAVLELALDDAAIKTKITHDYVRNESYTILVSVPFSSSARVDKIIDTIRAKYFKKQESGVG